MLFWFGALVEYGKRVANLTFSVWFYINSTLELDAKLLLIFWQFLDSSLPYSRVCESYVLGPLKYKRDIQWRSNRTRFTFQNHYSGRNAVSISYENDTGTPNRWLLPKEDEILKGRKLFQKYLLNNDCMGGWMKEILNWGNKIGVYSAGSLWVISKR